ncbi:NAD-dependent epimerase/dehydratase family protein [Streptomyces sp. NPDC058619]|uniref:NAD-dependent epimerase/dehydratase family protein n=1 Tax=unclassified Streptomyces TaxID=2593676 RepID=UPI0036657990
MGVVGVGGRVLVVGAAGFVGSAVVRRLVGLGVGVRLLVHRVGVPVGLAGVEGVEVVWGDLGVVGSLRGVCEGVGTVLHLASRVGGGWEECRVVNVEGTRALLGEARRAGVGRVVQLGTAAVYRDGVHRGAVEGELEEGPVSAASVTRWEGERLVLGAGGTVLRPHLVFGRGDRWVVPSLVGLLGRLPFWVDGGRARMSMVSVDVLADVLVELAVGRGVSGGVFHVGHPEPVSARELVGTVVGELGLVLPSGEVDVEGALAWLGGPGGPDAGVRRLVSLFAVDHWYDSGRLWGSVGVSPGPRFSQAFGRYADWYRGQL